MLTGAVDALGYDHAVFGAYEAGRAIGSTLFGIRALCFLSWH